MKPGSVRSSLRAPPPTVSAASMRSTEWPSRASSIAAARPFGPPPTTMASIRPGMSAVSVRRLDADGPEELPDGRAAPPGAGRAQLGPRREAIPEQPRPDAARRTVREWVGAEEGERRAVALEEPDEER